MKSKEQIINDLIKSIVELVDPLQIILFGSAARGEMSPDSDIDLLVVMPNGTHRRNTAMFLYSKIRGISIPYDILVTTEKDMIENKDDIGFIYYYALKEGKSIYVRGKKKAKVAGTMAKIRPK
ncbi:MAG: nucleotidyltransferase domain-containing protein [candidate division Zixibacteria bacterium]|nr:nucleotidyltransferase domain-containing protein [Candidatus Tariuqbacter arcticus]